MKNLRDELKQMKYELDLIQIIYCDKEEAKKFRKMENEKIPLPYDVSKDEVNNFFRYIDTDLSEQELNQLFMLRKILYLRTIKNILIFFVVITIIFLLISLFCFLGLI
ncbi:MAG: hypothetical protein Q8876_01265 [Bacillota bacterium]|nr:hypothetical protein [Bacillota bacterium]